MAFPGHHPQQVQVKNPETATRSNVPRIRSDGQMNQSTKTYIIIYIYIHGPLIHIYIYMDNIYIYTYLYITYLYIYIYYIYYAYIIWSRLHLFWQTVWWNTGQDEVRAVVLHDKPDVAHLAATGQWDTSKPLEWPSGNQTWQWKTPYEWRSQWEHHLYTIYTGWWFQTWLFIFHFIYGISWDAILPIDELHHFSER